MLSILYFKRRLLAHPGFQKKDGPDTSGMNAAAVANAAVSKEALDFFKTEYANTADERAAASTRANAISDAQLATMNQQNVLAKDYADYNKTTFRPLEQRMVREAQQYDTQDRRTAAANEAAADVQMASDTQMGVMSRNMMRNGINPGSGASLALQQQGALQTAKMSAGAQNAARKQVEATGYARMADAANMGRNLPSAQATAVQTGIQAGGASQASSGASLNATHSGSALMQNGFNTAIQGNQSAGNIFGQQAQVQSGGGNGMAGMMSGVGGIMQGMGAMGYSSKKLKHRKSRMSEEDALDQVNELNVENWDYKPGVADGGSHVGPYAEDVQRSMGDKVAPGGRMINLAAMGKKNTQSIQALTHQLEALEREIAGMEA